MVLLEKRRIVTCLYLEEKLFEGYLKDVAYVYDGIKWLKYSPSDSEDFIEAKSYWGRYNF